MSELKGIPVHWDRALITRELCSMLDPKHPERLRGSNQWIVAVLKNVGWVESDPLPGGMDKYFAALCRQLNKPITPTSILELMQMEEIRETMRNAIRCTAGTHAYNQIVEEVTNKQLPPESNVQADYDILKDMTREVVKRELEEQGILDPTVYGNTDVFDSTVGSMTEEESEDEDFEDTPVFGDNLDVPMYTEEDYMSEPILNVDAPEEDDPAVDKPVHSVNAPNNVYDIAPEESTEKREEINRSEAIPGYTPVCPRCQFDLTQLYTPPAVTPADISNYLFCVLGNNRFFKEISLFGGKIRATFRSLTPSELDVLVLVVNRFEAENSTIRLESSVVEYNNCRLALMLDSYKIQGGATYKLNSLLSSDILTVADFDAFYAKWKGNVVKTTELRKLLFKGLREFITIQEALDGEIEHKDFWDEAAIA